MLDIAVRLWDMKTCTNKVKYSGHNYSVWDVDVRYVFVNGIFSQMIGSIDWLLVKLVHTISKIQQIFVPSL